MRRLAVPPAFVEMRDAFERAKDAFGDQSVVGCRTLCILLTHLLLV
jgi:hypothetical protein